MCGPRILLDAFSLNDVTRFLLIEKNMIFRKDLGVATYLFIFFKGKQNKKENPKCDSLFGKDSLRKTKYGLRGEVTHGEGTIRTVAPLKVPKNGSLLIK